jgi:tRNA-dihydrouridine synthase A
VQDGRFGACLMAEPELVAACLAPMQRRVTVPVTVKCRIGIDDQDSEADLERFVSTVAAAGCKTFIVHARKAWLHGLSPKENREVPPLDYHRVFRLKEAHPQLEIVLNGGINSVAEAERLLAYVDGVMFGRAAYHTPYILADVDSRLFGDRAPPIPRHEVVGRLLPYVERHLARGGRLNNITRHVLGLYHGQPGARAFRRHLSERGVRDGAGIAVLLQALALVDSRSGAGRMAAE